VDVPILGDETFRTAASVDLVCSSRLDFALEQDSERESRKQA
jgi:hypothetical protein